MSTKWLLTLAASLLLVIPQGAWAERHILPEARNYLRGTVGSDVAAALKQGVAENRPVWIVAWDKVFFDSPDGHEPDMDLMLHYFFQNPETKNLVNQNFIQVFTTLGDPAIAQWVDKDDQTHKPIYLVFNTSGNLAVRDHVYGNPEVGLKVVQDISVTLGLKRFADPTPAGAVLPITENGGHIECQPGRYLRGSVTNDVTAALRRGAAEHWPVWIVAWDRVFFDSPDGQEFNPGNYGLRCFFEKPETRDLVSQNFIQVFTTLDDPAIVQWVDKGDRTHDPINLIFDKAGNFVTRNYASANPNSALKMVEQFVAQLAPPAAGEAKGAPPVVPSKPDPRLAIQMGVPMTPVPAPRSNTDARVASNTAPTRPIAPGSVFQTPLPRTAPPVARATPPQVPPAAVVPQQPALIETPEMSAKTGRAGKQIAIAQSSGFRQEQDIRVMSVDVSVHFFHAPTVPYEVQCFFISKNETTLARAIFDASVVSLRDANFRDQFISQPLMGEKRKFVSVPFSTATLYSDGSVGVGLGVTSGSSVTKGDKIEGWVVRVVAQGRVLRMESNQPNLLDVASHLAPQLDAVAAKVSKTAN